MTDLPDHAASYAAIAIDGIGAGIITSISRRRWRSMV